MTPLLSIVIANYNYGRFLEEAIQSVIAQSMGDQVELIICDAASTDNSVEIIKKYAAGLPPNTSRSEWEKDNNQRLTTNDRRLITWWCSEPDGGQSAAFNKGFSHSHGRFLTWLNADDVMLSGTIERLKVAAERHPDCEWFVGGVMWLDPSLHIFKCGRARRMSDYRVHLGAVNVCGPSSFFSKDLFDRTGGFDERFKYTMDSDLWLRFSVIQHVRFRPFVDYAWGLRLHADAKMSGHKVMPDGSILDGIASKDAFAKNLSRQAQLERERMWTDEKLGFVRKRMPRLVQMITADYMPAVFSRIDTWRYRGCFLFDVFSQTSMETVK